MAGWMTVQPSRHQVAIAGVVSDAQTGQVIPGAEVKLSKGSIKFSRWLNLKEIQHEDILNRQGSVALNSNLFLERDRTGLYLVTETALEGHFHFADLPSGSYDLFVSLPGSGTRYGTRQIEDVSITERNGSIEYAITNITLPPTGIKGRIVSADGQPIIMAKVQSEGSPLAAFSDRNGDYLITGLEVWQPSEQSSDSPRPSVVASARGYQSTLAGIWLELGEVKSFDITLTRK